MKKKVQIIFTAFAFLSVLFLNAQENKECKGFRTQTQGGWGAVPSGNNNGTYLYNNFAKSFPKGVTIGCSTGNTITFTTPQSITDFIPQGGTPSVLPKGNYNDKLPNANTSVIWGQTLAAMLNVGFDSTIDLFSPNSINIKDLIFTTTVFEGQTVLFVINEANKVIGGCSSKYTLSDLNTALTKINENYDNGTEDRGDLTCPKVAATTYSTTNMSICSGQSVVFNATTYTTAGTYSATLKNAKGGDSIATLNLTVKSPSSSTTNVSVCSSALPYSWNGSSYNAAGTYTRTLTNAAGCDSVATLNLTVKSPSSSTTNVSVCSSALPYSWNGSNYNAAGTYTRTLTNAAGCDSVATLNLTVKSPSSSTTNVSICSSALPYSWNGSSYNAAGTYSRTFTNAVGCDSVATLNLTVKSPSSSTTNVSVCSSALPYIWNGTNYNAAGTYNKTFTNAVGCDSIATLVLKVNQNPNAYIAIGNNESYKQEVATNNFSFAAFNNSGIVSYNWSLGDGTSATTPTVSKKYTKAGIYNVQLIASGAGGCNDTSIQTFIVKGAAKSNLAITECNTGMAPKTIVQTIPIASSSTDWSGANLKTITIQKFDTSLGNLNAVKVISNGAITTNFKVEVMGNMALGTKRLVYSQTKSEMFISGGGFNYEMFPPVLVDTFSATGYDGVLDYAGTSGKDFGQKTSTIIDSATILADDQLAAFKGNGNVPFSFYAGAQDSSVFPTGNARSLKTTNASGNITVIYYYCPVASDSVSSGSTGGVESKSLGDAITKRVVNKARENANGAINYQKLEVYGGSTLGSSGIEKGITGAADVRLSDLMPDKITGFTGFITSPVDLTAITNANEVMSIDFTYQRKAKAVAFATKTGGEVYSHTKPICDRLKGSKLLDVSELTINGYQLIRYTLQSANGNVEYACSFSVGTSYNKSAFTIQSNWLTKDYVSDNNMFNFQLWAVTPDLVELMAKDVIGKLTKVAPIEYVSSTTNGVTPKTYVVSGSRKLGTLTLLVKNKTNFTNAYFEVNEKPNEQSPVVTRRIPFTAKANGEVLVDIDMNDHYESDIWLYINDKVQDLVYMGDGSWSIDYNAAKTSIKEYSIINTTNRVFGDEYPVFRNVKVTATTNDYVSLFKLLKGGGVAQDLSTYKTLKFTAEGGNNLRITLIKNGITAWKDQYTVLIPLSEKSKDYYIDLGQFTSAANKARIVPNDVTTIVFSIEVNSGNTKTISNTISNISFTKDDALFINSLSSGELNAYPNPSNGKFSCSFKAAIDGKANIKIVELSTGKVMVEQSTNVVKGNNLITIDAADKLYNGIYLLVIDSNSTNYQRKQLMIIK